MSDLLDDVRALNPVPSCESPSLEDVWRRLEREPMVRPRRGRRVARPALGVAAAIAVAAVCLIVAASRAGVLGVASRQTAGPSAAVRRLAAGTITCDFGSVAGDHHARVVAVPTRGRSAITYCRGRYRPAGPGTASAVHVAFIACQTSATGVAVYVADGRPDQCHRLGDRVVPVGYAAAVRRAAASGPAASAPDDAAAVTV